MLKPSYSRVINSAEKKNFGVERFSNKNTAEFWEI